MIPALLRIRFIVHLLRFKYCTRLFRLDISFEILHVSPLQQTHKVNTINSILQICNKAEERKPTFVDYKHTYLTSWDTEEMAKSADS